MTRKRLLSVWRSTPLNGCSCASHRSCWQQAASAFVEQLSKTVTSRYHTPTFFSVYNGMDNPINYYSGITTSAPIESNDSSAYIDEWRETAWYKATH